MHCKYIIDLFREKPVTIMEPVVDKKKRQLMLTCIVVKWFIDKLQQKHLPIKISILRKD